MPQDSVFGPLKFVLETFEIDERFADGQLTIF